MTKDEALKMALEALEHDNPAGRSATITALRQAIEQAEKQEPVAYMDDKGYICNHTTNPERWTPLYTAPPKREWVWLTDGDITELFCEYEASQFPVFVRTIEAKLKEKNHVS